jgi:hypothetical protein
MASADAASDGSKPEGGMKKGLKGFGQKVSNLFTKLVLSEQTAIEIGTPYNVQHVQHVQADAHSSTGFSVCAWP